MIGSRGPCFEDGSKIISAVHHGRLSSTEHRFPTRLHRPWSGVRTSQDSG